MTETPLRIVVAEDDERLAVLMTSILEDDGRFLVVGHATTGDEAVRLCEERQPDIVLMDIAMPGGDGIGATRAIHARDRGQHVVIYTGSDEYEDVARAQDAGAAGFLHKDALTSPELADALHVLHTNYVRGERD
ncbi:MAG TPA: response regulator transcription factor [Gaiellaceae bacterium]|nr:response regulator transcription factor [Gaiellaceae bacterium]